MSKRFFVTLVSFIYLVGFSLGASAASLASGPLSIALSQVKPLTKIPVLLPSSLPAPMDADIHAPTGDGNEKGYEITLYYEQGMGDAGFAGYFSGKLNSPFPNYRHQVHLKHGVSGYFRASSCGSSCSPSTIEWRVGEVTYTAQLALSQYSASKQLTTMIAIANSAIEAGPR